jgi:hypothetical protein
MRRLLLALFLLLPASAAAQQRPIFDVDDFVDPRHHEGSVFASRLIAGAALNFIDDYRPRHHAATFVQWANNVYWKQLQLDYKHTEIRSGPTPSLQMCPCNPPIFFPTPPSAESTPQAPPSGAKDTVQFGFYWPWPRKDAAPVMLRTRLTVALQRINTVATFAGSNTVAARLSGRERSIGLETDTYLPLGRGIFGTLQWARTERTGTAADRTQQELVYTNRFPGTTLGSVIVRALLTVGAVTDRGGTGVNVVNPAFEAFYHHPKTRVNFHLVYSPQSTRSGTGGWETHHQIAFFADWGHVWLFKGASSSAPPPRSLSSPEPTSHR